MKRVLIICSLLVAIAGPLLSGAEAQTKVFRGGHLFSGARTADGGPPVPLRDAMRALGYVEGKNIA